jgi:SAM-dependent methyltransferase
VSYTNNLVQEQHQQKRHCAVCASERSQVLFHQNFATIDGASVSDGYDVVVCQDCGFGFANLLPEQAAFDAYYREMSKYEYQDRGGQESAYDLARFRADAEIIKSFIPNTQTRILEIGCATGGLLSLLKESGYDNVIGLDPSPICAEAAQNLYGIQVFTGTLSDVSVPEPPFDFLILIGVLEHIRDLEQALAKLQNMLSARGLMYVEVPNATQFAYWQDAPFQQFSTEHINFFSGTSLANLMQSHGFVQIFSQEEAREHSHGTMMPVICAIYKKDDCHHLSPVPDIQTERGLVDYIARSHNVDVYIRQTIDEVVTSYKPIIVWGVGTHTQRLLATSRLREANICAFVDSNPRYQGKKLNGIPIITPANLKEYKEPILISSRVFQQDIQQQIREQIKITNELILLYKV